MGINLRSKRGGVAMFCLLGLTACSVEHSHTSIFFLGMLTGWALIALAVVAIYGAVRALIRADDRENAAESPRRFQES